MKNNVRKLSYLVLILVFLFTLMPSFAKAQEPVQTASEFYYTGGVQAWTVPQSGTYRLETWGAQGGRSSFWDMLEGGKGGYSSADFQLTSGQTLYIFVGGKGEDGQDSSMRNYIGGWNGGGNSIADPGCNSGGAGGGASDIRIGGLSLNNRIIIAGGGGGSGGDLGGAGGGANQIGGSSGSATGGTLIEGGTGSYQGSLGQGGGGPEYANGNTNWHAGGGGGGYYGGGAGRDTSSSGGAGGSGFVNTNFASNIHGESGIQFGNGMARITPLNTQQVDLTKIIVSERSVSLPLGGETQLNVTAYYSDGSTKNITSLATFKSSNSSILNVNSTGLINAVGIGTADITITYKEKISTGTTKMISSRIKGTVY
ncbi:Ig-like protein group 2 [Neobacillus bataviensis]|uniref:receptor protein-tyrosine kinase n=1 Tax=Neobacillus bataviensis TaxID=220685 RepID=A0A561CGX7_9BACI|nr:glycine-rich protein [Neobacillus bataviensis]TWD90237.1 Ig-like protein group 2 [Neobacillus bataviensis]